MLKLRIIPTMLYKSEQLVKGEGFDSWRRVGSAMQAIKVYNLREVDELIFVDIAATNEGREPDYAMIDELADECFMPLTVGGGISSVEHVRKLLSVGADKVAIGTAALEDPSLVGAVAQRFGSQCIVVSIDFRRLADGTPIVCTHSGARRTERDPVELAREFAHLGAGEILLTSIERDGTMVGYDVELTRRVADAVGIPVIASGGAGKYDHMLDVVKRGHAAAIAAGAIFHFTEQTPMEAKRFLAKNGIATRV